MGDNIAKKVKGNKGNLRGRTVPRIAEGGRLGGGKRQGRRLRDGKKPNKRSSENAMTE